MNRLILALALAPALLAARAGAVEVLVRSADGPDQQGPLAEISGKALAVTAETGRSVHGLADLVAVIFPAAREPEAGGAARIYTISGDVIPAQVEGGEGGKLVAAGPWTGRFEIDTRSLAAVLLPAGLKNAELAAALARRGRRKDCVYLPNGDQMEGTLESLTGGKLRFKSALAPGGQDLDLADVAAIAFAELKAPPEPQGLYCVAELAGGGRVSGLPVRLDQEAIEWRTRDGATLKLAAGALSAIRVRGGRVTFLSEISPAAVEEKPFVEGLPFVWKWRADRDVFGKPLVLGGVKFERGLGVAAATKLTYKLDGGYVRFKAAVGVSDSTAPGGHTLFRVLVDGQEVFVTKPLLTRGDKPVAVDVGIAKAKELTLAIDFGDDSDLGDFGGWGEPRLIK